MSINCQFRSSTFAGPTGPTGSAFGPVVAYGEGTGTTGFGGTITVPGQGPTGAVPATVFLEGIAAGCTFPFPTTTLQLPPGIYSVQCLSCYPFYGATPTEYEAMRPPFFAGFGGLASFAVELTDPTTYVIGYSLDDSAGLRTLQITRIA